VFYGRLRAMAYLQRFTQKQDAKLSLDLVERSIVKLEFIDY
jgi:hypothetical protein